MQPKWLIESDVFDNEANLLKVLSELGVEHKTTGYVPASGVMENEKFSDEDCVIYYGSLNLAQSLMKTRLFKPGVFGPIENFNCDRYYPAFGEHMLNSDYTMLPFGELMRMRDLLYQRHGKDNYIFIRPASCLKEFTGMTIHRNKYEEQVKMAGFYDVPDHTMVVVSSPKDIRYEWRFVIANNQVVTGSCYRDGNLKDIIEVGADHPAWQLAAEMCQRYNPSPAWVLDICQTADGNYHFLECGCISFAGLYGCDLKLVVESLNRCAVEVFTVTT